MAQVFEEVDPDPTSDGEGSGGNAGRGKYPYDAAARRSTKEIEDFRREPDKSYEPIGRSFAAHEIIEENEEKAALTGFGSWVAFKKITRTAETLKLMIIWRRNDNKNAVREYRARKKQAEAEDDRNTVEDVEVTAADADNAENDDADIVENEVDAEWMISKTRIWKKSRIAYSKEWKRF